MDNLQKLIKKMEGYGKGNKEQPSEPVTTTSIKADKELEPVKSKAAGDYFVCDLQNYSFKDDSATMEAPIL